MLLYSCRRMSFDGYLMYRLIKENSYLDCMGKQQNYALYLWIMDFLWVYMNLCELKVYTG